MLNGLAFRLASHHRQFERRKGRYGNFAIMEKQIGQRCSILHTSRPISS